MIGLWARVIPRRASLARLRLRCRRIVEDHGIVAQWGRVATGIVAVGTRALSSEIVVGRWAPRPSLPALDVLDELGDRNGDSGSRLHTGHLVGLGVRLVFVVGSDVFGKRRGWARRCRRFLDKLGGCRRQGFLLGNLGSVRGRSGEERLGGGWRRRLCVYRGGFELWCGVCLLAFLCVACLLGWAFAPGGSVIVFGLEAFDKIGFFARLGETSALEFLSEVDNGELAPVGRHFVWMRVVSPRDGVGRWERNVCRVAAEEKFVTCASLHENCPVQGCRFQDATTSVLPNHFRFFAACSVVGAPSSLGSTISHPPLSPQKTSSSVCNGFFQASKAKVIVRWGPTIRNPPLAHKRPVHRRFSVKISCRLS